LALRQIPSSSEACILCWCTNYSAAFSDAFIQYKVGKGSDPFAVAWYLSDNTISIDYLQSDTVDVGITYNENLEKIAIQQGIVKQPNGYYYAFHDHFLLAGPPSNPAGINGSDDIYTIFSNLFAAAEAAMANQSAPTVRFISRYDKSATNLKESSLWIGIGQVPWATAYSTWYHQYISFPIQALTAAVLLGEYTISDRGTYLSISEDLQNQTTIYKASTDSEDDRLLNTAHLLIGAKATNGEMALNFANWVVSTAGQSVITGFKKNGQQLYTGAPQNGTTTSNSTISASKYRV
jgi:ABC-type tungstate transport system permease subunit